MRKIKFISLIMSLVLMVTFTPYSLLQIMAEELKDIDWERTISIKEEISVENKSIIDQGIKADSYIEKEMVEKRTDTSKQFLMSDGMIMIQKYGVPIHYEENGEFKEIDNVLKLSEKDQGEKYFENTANSFKVRFSEKLKADKGISLESNGYNLEFLPGFCSEENLQPSQAVLQQSFSLNESALTAENIEKNDVLDYSGKKLTIPVQPNVGESALVYENVFEGVDFEYLVNSMGVKENIVVNCPLDNYIFSYTIRAFDLYLNLTDSGEIVASSEEDGDIFVIPAPNMKDAEGFYSEEVYYTLEEEDNGIYKLNITADADWINEAERKFPVKIDPSVISVERMTANGLTLYRTGGIAPEYNQSRIKFGKVNSNTCNAIISFPNENDQFYTSGYQLAYSKLRYYIRSIGGNAAGSTDYTLYTAQTAIPLEDITSVNDINYSESPILLKDSIEATKFLSFDANHDARWEEAYFNPESFNGCADMVFLWYSHFKNYYQNRR